MINLTFSCAKGLLIATFVFVLSGCGAHSNTGISSPQAAEASNQVEQTQLMPSINVLVFSKTEGFRHNSIEPAIQLLQTAATERQWNLVTTEGSGYFTEANLLNFDVVVFLLTSGDVLNAEEQAAFEKFIQNGGGFAGIHSASDTEYDWAWYGGLVGAYFSDHPAIQTADVLLADASHASTRFLPCRWTLQDEWYNFRSNPAESNDITVLLWLDESTYSGGTMGPSHPIAWAHNYEGGRSWYTAAGHRAELYTAAENELFQRHILAGIEWAAENDTLANRESPDMLTPSAYLPSVTKIGCSS